MHYLHVLTLLVMSVLLRQETNPWVLVCSGWLTSAAGPPTARLTSEHLFKNEGDAMCLLCFNY